MAKKKTTPASADPALRGDAPTRAEFADMQAVLVKQLPDVAPDWWKRVAAARRKGNVTVLRMLFSEAENRLDHKRAKDGKAVLRILSRLLGLGNVVDAVVGEEEQSPDA
ncbi:MAG: hypothetical protein AB7K09_15645 [Planctomycetota bacterium]